MRAGHRRPEAGGAPPRPTTRFAPSPTGHLHLGHAAHMLFVWGIAELEGGRVLLRIEDHDGQRSRPAFEASILRDLDWLGFQAANQVGAGPSPYRQSDCGERYEGALARLRRTWRVYRCTCTRRQLARRVRPLPTGERPYPGTCRDAENPGSVPHALRLEWDPALAEESFRDGLQGMQRQEPRLQCGDLVVRDRIGQWSYQFAVTVDDLQQGIDFVVRGLDLLESTGRQMRLARMLGARRLPRYYHHPLMLGERGEKLAKRSGSTAIRLLRAAGARPADVLGLAAVGAGLLPEARPVLASDAGHLVERELPP